MTVSLDALSVFLYHSLLSMSLISTAINNILCLLALIMPYSTGSTMSLHRRHYSSHPKTARDWMNYPTVRADSCIRLASTPPSLAFSYDAVVFGLCEAQLYSFNQANSCLSSTKVSLPSFNLCTYPI